MPIKSVSNTLSCCCFVCAFIIGQYHSGNNRSSQSVETTGVPNLWKQQEFPICGNNRSSQSVETTGVPNLQLAVIGWYLYWYMLNLLKVSECKHTMQVFVMLLIWSLFRCFCKFVFTDFLTTWVCIAIVMFDSRMVISSIFWSYSLHFLFALNAIHFVYKLRLQTDHHTW